MARHIGVPAPLAGHFNGLSQTLSVSLYSGGRHFGAATIPALLLTVMRRKGLTVADLIREEWIERPPASKEWCTTPVFKPAMPVWGGAATLKIQDEDYEALVELRLELKRELKERRIQWKKTGIGFGVLLWMVWTTVGKEPGEWSMSHNQLREWREKRRMRGSRDHGRAEAEGAVTDEEIAKLWPGY